MKQNLLTFLTIFGCIGFQLVFGQMSGGGGGGEGGSSGGEGGSSGEDSDSEGGSSGGEGGSSGGSGGSGSGGSGSSSSSYECNYMIAYGSDGVEYPYGIDVCNSAYSSGAYTSYMFTCDDATTVTAFAYSGASCSGTATSSSISVGSTYDDLTVSEIECNATDYDSDNCVIGVTTAVLSNALPNCTDTSAGYTTTIYYVEDICITEGSGNDSVSFQFECNDDTVNAYYYYGATSCGGKGSADATIRYTDSECNDDDGELITFSCVDEDTSTNGGTDSGAYANHNSKVVIFTIVCLAFALSVLLN